MFFSFFFLRNKYLTLTCGTICHFLSDKCYGESVHLSDACYRSGTSCSFLISWHKWLIIKIARLIQHLEGKAQIYSFVQSLMRGVREQMKLMLLTQGNSSWQQTWQIQRITWRIKIFIVGHKDRMVRNSSWPQTSQIERTTWRIKIFIVGHKERRCFISNYILRFRYIFAYYY